MLVKRRKTPLLSLWEVNCFSFEQTWIPFTQGGIVPRLKLAQWFWRRFLNFFNVFSLFCIDLPLEKGEDLYLDKLEFPLPKDALCQVWLKLAQWFWRRFINFVNVFSLVRNYLDLEKGETLHLNKFEFPSPENALCQVGLKLVQWFLRRFF